jgi:hypothetical protein
MSKHEELQQVWHNDGHKIELRINKAELEVLSTLCPHEDSAACKNMAGDCVVTWFINRFGMECNGGICPPVEFLDISWTIVGDINNFDSCQVWFMPLTDDIFSAWMISNTAEEIG